MIPGLVSVIIPVYNRAQLVEKAVISVLDQTYKRIEIIAVNDGSTDDSAAVLNRLAERHGPRVVILHQYKNEGQTKARNRGMAEAKGEYIAFLDSDDTWEQKKLELQIPLFKEDVGLAYCGIYEVDEGGQVLRTVLCEPEMRGHIYHHLLIKNRMTGGTVVVTRKALDKVGFFDESFRAAENWDLWIRIAKEFRVEYANLPLVRYLRHPGNMSQNQDLMICASSEILKKHLPPGQHRGQLERVYKEAYANQFYSQGVAFFSRTDYADARRCFYRTWRYRPFYRDSLLRVMRSYCGFRINKWVSKIGKMRNSRGNLRQNA
jgi:glycosyltransferase involved in cell wall biosynthesis